VEPFIALQGGHFRMKVFSFDPSAYRDTFLSQGWLHIKQGVTPEFVEVMKDFVARELNEEQLKQFALEGKKGQGRFEFPPEVDFPNEMFDVIAEVCGLDRETIALSERHINAYNRDAKPDPAPHKDRDASKVSVGLCIEPADSEVVIYPGASRERNPYVSAATYYDSLPEDQKPEKVLTEDQAVAIRDEPGDVVMFYGSEIWHLRRRSAGSVNLYLKFNDFDYDPLGEDPTTIERRERTREVLRSNADLNGAVVKPSRQLEQVTHLYSRNALEVRQAKIWGRNAIRLDEAEFQILQSLNGGKQLSELGAGAESHVRRLAEHGVVDLIQQSY
jgi:hypothetical protein